MQLEWKEEDSLCKNKYFTYKDFITTIHTYFVCSTCFGGSSTSVGAWESPFGSWEVSIAAISLRMHGVELIRKWSLHNNVYWFPYSWYLRMNLMGVANSKLKFDGRGVFSQFKETRSRWLLSFCTWVHVRSGDKIPFKSVAANILQDRRTLS